MYQFAFQTPQQIPNDGTLQPRTAFLSCWDNAQKASITYTLGDLSEAVLGLYLRKVHNFRCKILGYLSFIELTRNNLTELGRNHARMRVVFSRDVDAKYIGIPGPEVVRLLEMELYNN